MCVRLRVRSLEGSCAKAVFLYFVETCTFLGLRYYRGKPRYYRWRWVAHVLAQLRPRHGTIASIAAVIFYCRWKSGTTALLVVLPPERYYRDDTRYYRAGSSAWG